MLNIIGIKTNKGYYIADAYTVQNPWSSNTLSNKYVNGKIVTPTFDKMWFFVENEPIKVQHMGYKKFINDRFELKDKQFLSEKIPDVIPYQEACYIDKNGDEVFKDNFKTYSSLYEIKRDEIPPQLEDVEFEYETICELNIDKIDSPPEFNYAVQKTNYSYEGTRLLKNDEVKHQIIDKIITPSILLHNKPSFLNSKQVYDILRQYIIENINPKVAKITSDYNFCFIVKKIISLAEPYTSSYEQFTSKGKSYRPPHYQKLFISKREVEVFEMTHDEDCYKGYTPIPSIHGENEYDLKEKIDALCENVIAMINEPLKECPCCKGAGVILEEQKTENQK